MPMPPLDALLPRFGLAPGRLLPEHILPGSPERCLARWALSDAEGRLWMLERIHPEQNARREELARLLHRLQGALAPAGPEAARLVPAYLPLASPAPRGGFVLHPEESPGGSWQISPFVPGVDLPRPDYLRREDLGHALALALIAVGDAGARLPEPPQPPQADLCAYRDGLFATLARRRPDLSSRLAPYRRALEPLGETLAALPPRLAHGDLHPLNVIWGPRGERPGILGVRALIDWEFAGVRPGPYDAANCLGCAGFEHPSGLAGGFALGFMAVLRDGVLQARELAALPLLVLASRLGWLAEWLRRADAEMLGMELDYLDILLAGGERLGRLWRGE